MTITPSQRHESLRAWLVDWLEHYPEDIFAPPPELTSERDKLLSTVVSAHMGRHVLRRVIEAIDAGSYVDADGIPTRGQTRERLPSGAAPTDKCKGCDGHGSYPEVDRHDGHTEDFECPDCNGTGKGGAAPQEPSEFVDSDAWRRLSEESAARTDEIEVKRADVRDLLSAVLWSQAGEESLAGSLAIVLGGSSKRTGPEFRTAAEKFAREASRPQGGADPLGLHAAMDRGIECTRDLLASGGAAPPPRKRAPRLPEPVREILEWSPSSDHMLLLLSVGTDGQRAVRTWVDSLDVPPNPRGVTVEVKRKCTHCLGHGGTEETGDCAECGGSGDEPSSVPDTPGPWWLDQINAAPYGKPVEVWRNEEDGELWTDNGEVSWVGYTWGGKVERCTPGDAGTLEALRGAETDLRRIAEMFGDEEGNAVELAARDAGLRGRVEKLAEYLAAGASGYGRADDNIRMRLRAALEGES